MSVVDPLYEPHVFKPHPRTAFAPIVSAFEVERSIAELARVWIRDYLAEVARQRGLDPDAFPAFRSIVASARQQRLLEDQLPTLILASPGIVPLTTGHVEARGSGAYTARWRLDAGAIVSARGNRQAVKLARFYAAAIRAMIVQQATDPRWALVPVRRVDWTGERYDELDSTADRTLCSGVANFIVEVPEATNWLEGPTEPTYPRSAELPEVDRVNVTVTKFPEDEEA